MSGSPNTRAREEAIAKLVAETPTSEGKPQSRAWYRRRDRYRPPVAPPGALPPNLHRGKRG